MKQRFTLHPLLQHTNKLKNSLKKKKKEISTPESSNSSSHSAAPLGESGSYCISWEIIQDADVNAYNNAESLSNTCGSGCFYYR